MQTQEIAHSGAGSNADILDLASIRLAKEPWDWRARVYAATDLTPTARLVALFYQERFINRSSGYGFATYAKVAGELGLSERTVRQAMSDLQTAGFVTMRRHRFQGSNQIRMALPKAATSCRNEDNSISPIRQPAAAQSGSLLPDNLRIEPSKKIGTLDRESVVEGQGEPAPSESIPIGKEGEQEPIGPARAPRQAISTVIASHFGIAPEHGLKIYNDLPLDIRRDLNVACMENRLRRSDVLRAIEGVHP